MSNENNISLDNMIIQRFRDKKERQAVFLNLIIEEIGEMTEQKLPVVSQVNIIEDKYNVEIVLETYRSWLRNHKPLLQRKNKSKNEYSPFGEKIYKELSLSIAQNAFYLILATKENLSYHSEVHSWSDLQTRVDSFYRGVQNYIVFYEENGHSNQAAELESLHNKVYPLIKIVNRPTGYSKSKTHMEELNYDLGYIKGWIHGKYVNEDAGSFYIPLSETEEELKLSTRFFVDE